jgi:hypothetical protein
MCAHVSDVLLPNTRQQSFVKKYSVRAVHSTAHRCQGKIIEKRCAALCSHVCKDPADGCMRVYIQQKGRPRFSAPRVRRANMEVRASIYGCSGHVGPTCTWYTAPCHSRSQPAHPQREHRPREGAERRGGATVHRLESPFFVAGPRLQAGGWQ